MDDSILKLELENLRELLRLKNFNNELLDANHNLLTRLVQLSESVKLPIDIETQGLLASVRHILDQIRNDQPTLNTDKNNREVNRTSCVSC